MKRLVLLVMATTLGLVSLSWAGSILWEDKFTSLDPGWGATDQYFDIKDGKMIVQPAKNESYTVVYEGNIFPNDLDASISMKFIKADDPAYGSGLVFWSKGSKDYYALMMNANGWFTVQRRIGDRYINPMPWRENGAIKKGAGVDNRLRVVD